jgi:hypothetical protein
MAYFQIEPHGEERADYRAGLITSTIANIVRKKGSKPHKPEDFMPKFGEREEPEQDWQQQLRMVKTLNAAFGGTTRGSG